MIKTKLYNNYKIGDSVRVYENDYLFIEGKIVKLIPETTMKFAAIEVDWGEYVCYYHPNDLTLEHRDGDWSWLPQHSGVVIRQKV